MIVPDRLQLARANFFQEWRSRTAVGAERAGAAWKAMTLLAFGASSVKFGQWGGGRVLVAAAEQGEMASRVGLPQIGSIAKFED
jgi:hypothetical protein